MKPANIRALIEIQKNSPTLRKAIQLNDSVFAMSASTCSSTSIIENPDIDHPAYCYLHSILEVGELEEFLFSATEANQFFTITQGLTDKPNKGMSRLLLRLIREKFFDAILDLETAQHLSKFIEAYFTEARMLSDQAFKYLTDFPIVFKAAFFFCYGIHDARSEDHPEICLRIRQDPGLTAALITYQETLKGTEPTPAEITNIFASPISTAENIALQSLSDTLDAQFIRLFYRSETDKRSSALCQLHLLKALKIAERCATDLVIIQLTQAMTQFLNTLKGDRVLKCALHCIERTLNEKPHCWQRYPKVAELRMLAGEIEPSLHAAHLMLVTQTGFNPPTLSYKAWRRLFEITTDSVIQANFPIDQMLATGTAGETSKSRCCLPFKCCTKKSPSRCSIRVTPLETTL